MEEDDESDGKWTLVDRQQKKEQKKEQKKRVSSSTKISPVKEAKESGGSQADSGGGTPVTARTRTSTPIRRSPRFIPFDRRRPASAGSTATAAVFLSPIKPTRSGSPLKSPSGSSQQSASEVSTSTVSASPLAARPKTTKAQAASEGTSSAVSAAKPQSPKGDTQSKSQSPKGAEGGKSTPRVVQPVTDPSDASAPANLYQEMTPDAFIRHVMKISNKKEQIQRLMEVHRQAFDARNWNYIRALRTHEWADLLFDEPTRKRLTIRDERQAAVRRRQNPPGRASSSASASSLTGFANVDIRYYHLDGTPRDPSHQAMKAFVPVKKEIPETVPPTATTSAASTTVRTPAESTGSIHEQPRIDWNTLMEQDSAVPVGMFPASELQSRLEQLEDPKDVEILTDKEEQEVVIEISYEESEVEMIVTDEWTPSQVKKETSEGEVRPKTESAKEYEYYPCPVAVPPRPKGMGYRSYCQLVKHKLNNATQYRRWSAWERNEKQRKRSLGEIPSSEQSSQSTAGSSRPSSRSSITSSRSSVASHQSKKPKRIPEHHRGQVQNLPKDTAS